jgi:hypothetical protein
MFISHKQNGYLKIAQMSKVWRQYISIEAEEETDFVICHE